MKNHNYLSSGNSKLKAQGIFAWGIPAGKTCPAAGECAKGCYAMQGFFVMPTVKAAQAKRLSLSKSNSFVQTISAEIKRRKVKTLRIHDSGDFYSVSYLNAWLEIIQSNPSVKFYAYTKMIPLFKGKPLPDNFTVIYSFGGKFDFEIDTRRDRHSVVFDSKEALDRAGYVDTSELDANAFGVSHKIGLIYHGHKSKAWNTQGVAV